MFCSWPPSARVGVQALCVADSLRLGAATLVSWKLQLGEYDGGFSICQRMEWHWHWSDIWLAAILFALTCESGLLNSGRISIHRIALSGCNPMHTCLGRNPVEHRGLTSEALCLRHSVWQRVWFHLGICLWSLPHYKKSPTSTSTSCTSNAELKCRTSTLKCRTACTSQWQGSIGRDKLVGGWGEAILLLQILSCNSTVQSGSLPIQVLPPTSSTYQQMFP